MKYIRTKDGRIVKHPHPNAEVFTFRYEIEKQADTIEELCDYLILFIDDDIYPIFYELFWQDKVEQVKRIAIKELIKLIKDKK